MGACREALEVRLNRPGLSIGQPVFRKADDGSYLLTGYLNGDGRYVECVVAEGRDAVDVLGLRIIQW